MNQTKTIAMLPVYTLLSATYVDEPKLIKQSYRYYLSTTATNHPFTDIAKDTHLTGISILTHFFNDTIL